MKRLCTPLCVLTVLAMIATSADAESGATGAELSRTLTAENKELGIEAKPIGLVDDMTYLRRTSVDLIGRIPTHEEVEQYLAWSPTDRRSQLIDRLMADSRFVDRWTTFFADMLRLRSNAPGGAAALAFVHKAIEEDIPYDEMARRFISANGKAGAVPEVAYVLGDNADPMALAGVTAQVFMGIRISCAQCHDHPFDKWTQEDFYGFAAFFGKTRRYENDFTNTIYTSEVKMSSVLWPPEGEVPASERKPALPKFLVDLIESKSNSEYIARLERQRKAEQDLIEAALAEKAKTADLDSLLGDAAERALEGALRGKKDAVSDEARREREAIDLTASYYNSSELRTELAGLIANPRNRYFASCFVNRVWADLVGRGIVNPIDDFSDGNKPSHPQTLDFLANEFIASGFQIKPIIKMIVTSEPYMRGQAVGFDALQTEELQSAFLAAPPRRMLSEVLYDSIVTAGHLFEYKYPQGANMRTISNRIRVAIPKEGEEDVVVPQALVANAGAAMKPSMKAQMASLPGYSLEAGIELDFDAVLKKAVNEARGETVEVEAMKVKSAEEIEAERMQMEGTTRRRYTYIYRTVERTFDDNPIFSSSFRMASPANPEHFVRIFGQTDRAELGVPRDHAPSMRQGLMMLNGKMTHEASRVGSFEPMHQLLVGKNADLNEAVKLAYVEVLTRQPDADEIAMAAAIVSDGDTLLDGMADLRWVLLNSNEFRYLP